MNPQQLSCLLAEKKMSLSEYARYSLISFHSLSKEFKKYNVQPYKAQKKEKANFVCILCGKSFAAYARPSRTDRNKYCSVECSKSARRKRFDESTFRFAENYFITPSKALGSYENLELGIRQRSFVNRDKVNHFFFQDGIYDENTAYIYGVLLTDGSIYRNGKGTYNVRLQMTDTDIVETVSKILENKTHLSIDENRGTLTLSIASPYLFNDLKALGCVPNKTEIANYPVISPDLDRHLIRGIIDGDGSWVKQEGLLSLQLCGNDRLLYGVYDRVKFHLNLSPQALQYLIDSDQRIRMKSFSQMRYNTSDSLKIRDWLYKNAVVYGNRKFQRTYSEVTPYTEKITTSRLAKHLGVSVDFVKKSVKKYALPCHYVGPYRVFEEGDIPQWLEFLRAKLADPQCRLANKPQLINKWLNALQS